MTVASAAELQSMYDAALRRERKLYGAAPTTIEAVMYSLRERGEAAMTVSDCKRRLSDLSPVKVQNVIERLHRLRPKYPAITDDLLLMLAAIP
jgi:hypothetical protein